MVGMTLWRGAQGCARAADVQDAQVPRSTGMREERPTCRTHKCRGAQGCARAARPDEKNNPRPTCFDRENKNPG
jgi:hypothetical protein